MGNDRDRKGGREQKRGRKRMGRTRGSGGLASSLLKAIGVSEERKKAPVDREEMEDIEGDVYEYEEGVPEEERGKNKRFDDVDVVEYALPQDFKDEEIDEEIDEEAASGGDEVYADIQRVAIKRRKEIDLNSDEDEDEEAVDDEDDVEDDEEGQEVETISDGSEEDEEAEDEDEDEDEGKHERMIEDITGKSANRVSDRQGRRGNERVLLEAYPESEFNLNPSSVSANANSGITVEDLMTPLHDMAGFGTVRKRMEQLQKRGGPVEAPLPKVIQERLNRKAGYEKTNEDVTKWQSMVKMNREAPTLVFNKREPAPTLSTASLAAHFKPTTDFEKEVHSLLRDSKLAEVRDVEAAEALELNKLTVDEVRERQERLAKMRNLLFRHEAKAKRVKKIKSKTFHRLLLKDQKSKAENTAAIAEADPEASKAAAMKREFNRAQERMTLKHKNSSRWAKRILKRGIKASENDGTRDAIAEQLRTHAALTRKIQSAARSDSDDTSSDSEEESEDVVSGLVLEGNSRSKVLAKAKVATLKALEDGNEGDIPTTGLFSLPFMARAIEKKKKTAHDDAMAILEQLNQAGEDGNVLGLDDDYSRSQNGHNDETVESGRISFGIDKQANVRVGRTDSVVDSDNATDEDSDEDFVEGSKHTADDSRVIPNTLSFHSLNIPRAKHHTNDSERVEAQSHLQADTGQKIEIAQNGRISSVGVGVETVPAKKWLVVMAGTQKDVHDQKALVEEAPSQIEGSGAVLDGTKAQITFSDDDSDADVQGIELLDATGSQQELIRHAFAGDDVEAEFENVKSQALEEEVPQDEGPVSLPGWGQWTRVQQNSRHPAWLLKEQETLKKKREQTLSKRKDANLKHVIISEKQDKKAAKFTSASVPFPFTSREVFESSTRLPIGRDFNTDKAYRDMIRPAVIKSAGHIIDPMKLEKSSVKEKETEGGSYVTKRKPTFHVAQRKATVHMEKRKRHQ